MSIVKRLSKDVLIEVEITGTDMSENFVYLELQEKLSLFRELVKYILVDGATERILKEKRITSKDSTKALLKLIKTNFS